MVNRQKAVAAFEASLERLRFRTGKAILRPRKVALLAHTIYCEGLGPLEHRPSPETFRKFSTGQLPFPEITALLEAAGVRARTRANLDRAKLRAVFEEAVKRLESRLLSGRARPMQVVRRAHELYTRDTGGTPPPSHRTFEDLIYGKSADPEFVTLIKTALKGKDSE